ncbi:hypothetical protein, conserved [Trypanosoma brucei brucei TREU927]|uniref:Uncharacterized protein n=1 Tax=Trypanosoma brucei brucei (strain 927/4 GUTat10.1) TaxID=185431 RepID=Q57Z65_TRYB2|nr:hypothetical protein, conserved [Trypanosoma brucei brucei TREU927]AAX79568.1 hypothetical protein, conserved [Trypanosoma brucei]AAZ11441.1 hypothetical protein, conserved [Trypanosoma brucei brucei TREU927]
MASLQLGKSTVTRGSGHEVGNQTMGVEPVLSHHVWTCGRGTSKNTPLNTQPSFQEESPPVTNDRIKAEPTTESPRKHGVTKHTPGGEQVSGSPDHTAPDGRASTLPPSECCSSPNGLHPEAKDEDPPTLTTAALPTAILSRENLLIETAKQQRELQWYKDRCREQEVALCAVNEKQAVLEDALIGARIAALNEKERRREFVAMAAAQRREARLALEPQVHALRVMEGELGGLRRELRHTRKLLEQSEKERVALTECKGRYEAELGKLRNVNERIHGELKVMHSRCAKLEQVNAKNIEVVDAEACEVKQSKNTATTDVDDEHRREVDATLHITFLQLYEEMERRQLEAAAVREVFEVYVDYLHRIQRETCGTMLLLCKHGKQLVNTLTRSDASLSDGGCPDDGEVGGSCAYTTLLRCANEVGKQLQAIETAIGDQLLTATQQQRDMQNLLLTERRTHQDELRNIEQTLQTVRQGAEDMKEKLTIADCRYNQLAQAVKRHCRQLLSVSAKGSKNKSKSGNSKQERKLSENSAEREVTAVRKIGDLLTIEGKGNNSVSPQVASPAELLNPAKLLLGDVPSSGGEIESLLALLKTSQQAACCALEDMRETLDSNEAQWQKERQRLIAATTEVRQRHQATTKRFQASLTAARATEVDLEKKLSAAVVERKVAVKKAEIAEMELQSFGKRHRQLQQELQAMKEDCELQRKEVGNRTKDIDALREQLTERREEHFEMAVLRGRCDDLVRITDALEQRVQREEKGKHALYEVARCFCGVLIAVVMRVRTVVAERRAMCRAYEAATEECRSMMLELRDTIKDIKVEETRRKESKRLAPFIYHPSFFAVATVSIACTRMSRATKRSRRPRRVSFELHDSHADGQDDDGASRLSVPACGKVFAPPNSLRGVVESVPLLSELFRRPFLTNIVRTVQIPPLRDLLPIIVGIYEKNNTVGSTYLLQQVIDIAEVDVASNEYRAHFAPSMTPSWKTDPSKWVRVGKQYCGRSCSGPSKMAPAQRLREVFHFLRHRIDKLKREQEKHKEAMCGALEENRQLRAQLEESQQMATSLLRKQEEYELEAAVSSAARGACRGVDQRLSELYDELHKEREARRVVEEVNAQLRMREVELLASSHKMRDEVRSLSIELAEQQQSYTTDRLNHSSCNYSHRPAAAAEHSKPLYHPRSVCLSGVELPYTSAQ